MLEVPTYTDKVPWKPILAKVLVVLLFPLICSYGYSRFYYASILFFSGISSLTTLDSVLMILVSILLLLPGIYIERRIKSKPITTRVRKSVLAVVFATWLFPFLGFVYAPIAPYLFLYLYIPLITMPILSNSFFIILPLLHREFILRQTPEKYQSRSFVELSRFFKQQFGRRRFLPLIIWSGLLFSPLLVFGPWEINIESLLYSITLVMDGPLLIERFNINQFLYTISMVYMMPSAFLIFSLRFVFIRDVFRFNKGNITQSRLISMGVLSEIAPAAMLTLQQFATIMVIELPFGYYSWILPTPLFPLLGYIFVRLSRSTIPSDAPWDDDEHIMWFEEKPQDQPRDPNIKVPISYMIRSLIRRLRR
ncbi:MAG: hypothetical protein ACFFF9_04615 [Candidatus Thorarchaeota archaeon]